MAATDQHMALPEAPTTEPSRRPPSSRSLVFAWAGVLAAGAAVAALAVTTFTADDDVDNQARRLAAQAEQYERQAHLDGQANTYGRDSGATTPSGTGNRAAQRAEDYERQAHLGGQAKTYGRDSGATTPSGTGNRAAQRAEDYERQAHLGGQAKTYGRDSGATPHNNAQSMDGTAEDSGALGRP